MVTLLALSSLSLRAEILFQDSTNYPYLNGTIEGQGQWYCYSPSPSRQKHDAYATNNVLILNSTNTDAVATPTNGWVNPNTLTFASFSINVSDLPTKTNGGYFCEFQDNNDTNDVCHIFLDTRDTSVPGTYRLGIANYDSTFAVLPGEFPPTNFPVDLSTGVNYTVVISYDINLSPDNPLRTGTLWVNPSEQDYLNAINSGGGPGQGYVYGSDTTSSSGLLNIDISQIGFSPYADAGISNVIAATTFEEVNSTNPPVFGIQPQSGTYYSGNSATFYAVASAVDATSQWYDSNGPLVDDGINIIGSSSNTLIINNLSVSDTYYDVVTDTYGNTLQSSNAVLTLITAQTQPFFPASETPENLTNNVFTGTEFTNTALGTGPLYYQWYFAPTNVPTAFSPLPGQNSAALNLYLTDFTSAGQYFVVASNSTFGGSIAFGPTNSLVELPPTSPSILQLHLLAAAQPTNSLDQEYGPTLEGNDVTVGGYVVYSPGYSGSGESYDSYFIQDASGNGVDVYLAGYDPTNTPPIGTYVNVTGPVDVFGGSIEIMPANIAAIIISNAPVVPVTPKFANPYFYQFITNVLGSNSIVASSSLITLTNVYFYTNKTGGAVEPGYVFKTNANTSLYITIGQYHFPNNTNYWTCYQYGYNRGQGAILNAFGTNQVPSYCYQLTGIYLPYDFSSPEIEPSRLVDYVTNPPASFPATLSQSKGVATVNWPVQAGSTYSVLTATNVMGPWTNSASGLGFYPATGAFTDNKPGKAKFYQIASP